MNSFYLLRYRLFIHPPFCARENYLPELKKKKKKKENLLSSENCLKSTAAWDALVGEILRGFYWCPFNNGSAIKNNFFFSYLARDLFKFRANWSFVPLLSLSLLQFTLIFSDKYWQFYRVNCYLHRECQREKKNPGKLSGRIPKSWQQKALNSIVYFYCRIHLHKNPLPFTYIQDPSIRAKKKGVGGGVGVPSDKVLKPVISPADSRKKARSFFFSLLRSSYSDLGRISRGYI